MSKKIHNKLVRDHIPTILAQHNIESFIRILDKQEYIDSLNKKLQEEVQEFLLAADQMQWVEELADILEVIHALLKSKEVSFDILEEVRRKKKEKRGGFEKKIFLRETLEKK